MSRIRNNKYAGYFIILFVDSQVALEAEWPFNTRNSDTIASTQTERRFRVADVAMMTHNTMACQSNEFRILCRRIAICFVACLRE